MKVYVPFEFKMTGYIPVEATRAGEAFDKGYEALKALPSDEIMAIATPDWDYLDINMERDLENEHGGAVFTGYEEC